MKPDVKQRLDDLNENYKSVAGKQASHFFCPILFVDEPVELCQAHIINEALPESSRAWTIQRKDVDGFYGSRFESDFIDIQYTDPGSAEDLLSNPHAIKRLSPKLLLNDDPVDFFRFKGKKPLPEEFTQISYIDGENSVQFGVKMNPEEVGKANDGTWELLVEKDLTIPAIVSTIKAAHLTFFHLLGYHYALSAGGRFVGKDILGNFYLQNHDKTKKEANQNAYPYFDEYSTLVRPLEVDNLGLKGTLEDGLVHVCWLNSKTIWAFIVYVRTHKLLSAVMLPYLPSAEAANKFQNFLSDDSERVLASLCKFSNGTWDNQPRLDEFIWPKKGFLFSSEEESF